MKSVVIDEAAEGSTIMAMLAMEDRRAKLLGIYKIIDDVEDPETCAGRMLGAATAQIKADAPVLRPYGPIPLQPVSSVVSWAGRACVGTMGDGGALEYEQIG